MNKRERVAYQAQLRGAARSLGLEQVGDLEHAIIEHCLTKLREWVVVHDKPETLSQLVIGFATSLDMRFEEVRGQADMASLLDRMDPAERPMLAALRTEFGEDTNAATVLRVNRKSWEPAYLAIINCEGKHEFRRYFSKWHEIGHRLLEGQQLTLALRQTKVERPEPEEILVDQVAAALAFFPDMFVPPLLEECAKDGCVTFNAVDRVRERLVPEASREATLRASLRHTTGAVWFLRCSMGLKADERRRLNSPQLHLIATDPPEAKLRVQAAAFSPAAASLGVRFHPNMTVPETSVVAQAFGDEWGAPIEGEEPLDDWQTTSGGPVGSGAIHVEAMRVGNEEVWALVQLLDSEDSR